MGGKINNNVIYTSIFGNHHGLIPQQHLPGFDFICFTDQTDLKAKPWKIIQVEAPFPKDLTRSNRLYKILAHQFLSSYEKSIYLDANFLIIGDLNIMIDQYLKSHNMAVFNHAETFPDNRDCIYAEGEAIHELREKGLFNKDSKLSIDKHIKYLKSNNYPENNGLIKGSCLLRNHHAEEVKTNMQDWWYMVENFSKRDQMSFNYVAWKNNFDFRYIPGDIRRGNPYIYWMGNHRKDWTFKVLKFKIKRKLGLD